MDLRKVKVGVKHGAPLRGVADRLKQQSAINRIEKRRETTKRFRRSTDVTLTTSCTSFALQNAVHAIKVRCCLIHDFHPRLNITSNSTDLYYSLHHYQE